MNPHLITLETDDFGKQQQNKRNVFYSSILYAFLESSTEFQTVNTTTAIFCALQCIKFMI